MIKITLLKTVADILKMDKLMSQKEAKQAQVLELLKEHKISQQEASKRLGITTRQVRRLTRRYQAAGLAGLVSKKRGRASNRRLNETLRARAIDLIGTHYRDFGPTLACEKLAGLHGIELSVESTRQIMIKAGYWQPKKGGTVCAHPMRERRARFGELIQIDGSPHDWFEGRGDYCTLLVFIDDATGRLTQLRFAPTETTLGYMHVLHDHIIAHGVPVALYSDKHSIFRINAKDADPEAETQFSRASRELGIECIHAHSPQAKGRVERVNQTLQDRLVKEMRLAGINDMIAQTLGCQATSRTLTGVLQSYPKTRLTRIWPIQTHGPPCCAPCQFRWQKRFRKTCLASMKTSCYKSPLPVKVWACGARKSRYTSTLTEARNCSGRNAN